MKKLLLFLLLGFMANAQTNVDQLPDMVMCDINSDGFALFDLTSYDAMILEEESPNNYSITYHETPDDAEENVNAIASPQSYINIVQNQQTIYVRVTEMTGENNYETGHFNISVNPAPVATPLAISIIDNNDEDPEDGSINMALEAVLNPVSALNPLPVFEADFFTDESLTMPALFPYTVNQSVVLYYRVLNSITGCINTSSIEITVLPGNYVTPVPTGETLFGYELGDTLANIPVEGENIQWYATETSDAPLSMSTELTNDTTYYATQTIAGQESADRLAVKVYSIIMGFQKDTFNAMKHYPNPTASTLNIENANSIDSIKVTNALGQKVFTQAINSNSAQVDVSSISKGVYFVTVTSGSTSKIIKIIKE
ncbi:T9SS type A sorting domain-containing protein [Flavobacterium hauense]